jgi:integrase
LATCRGRASSRRTAIGSFRLDGERLAYARSCVALAKRLWSYAAHFHAKQFTTNPFVKLAVGTAKPRRTKWLPSQVLRLIEAAAAHNRTSIAIATMFCYELGQRPTDARILMRSAFEAGKRIRVVQSKTDQELLLPVSDVLADWIAKIPAGQDQLVLDEATGKEYTKTRLSHVFAEIRDLAGLPSHLQLRDLRRTCISELGDLGASDDELMSVSGHTTRQMLSVYSVAAFKRAHRAMQKRWAWRAEQELADQEQEETEAA